jgi:glycosyltransferase involved in cell wall biosynthesis
MDDRIVSTLVLVTPANRSDGSEERFTGGHLRELAARFDHVVVVLDHGPGAPVSFRIPPQPPGPVARTGDSLESVLDSLSSNGGGAAVIIDGDIRAVRRAGSVARQHAVPALWWCDGPPADEVQRATVDVIDAVLAPVDESSVGRYLAIGAGIDTRALGSVALPPQPPLRILVLGRAVEDGGLAIPLRALAEARARGVDAHLLIVDSLRVSSRSARRLAESLIADLMLTQSVELLDIDGPVWLPDILQRVHAVIDAGAGTAVDHVLLEAMACGRPVLSSRASLTPLLAGETLPLVFATGDASSLAGCISALAASRNEELAEVGARLRARVEREHSLPQWGASIAAVVEALHAPRVS